MKQTKESNKTNLNKSNFRNKNAITLIALVVTIVVLLILAGVTISLLLDENGIIAKSKDARLENRASQIEDEIGMWKQNNFINKESGQAQEKADTILASLISRNILKEEEIDREQRIITIKKKDGSILKEINYSPVTINISKNPETTKSGAVLLTVESVEGTESITSEEEFINCIDTMGEEQKKEIIKKCYVKALNIKYPSAKCKNFGQALEFLKDKDRIDEATEDAFWEMIESETGEIDTAFLMYLDGWYYNQETQEIKGYIVTNPAEEVSDTYMATENGIYTFKIQDVVTGKIYIKKVEVTNIDETLFTPAVVGKTIDYSDIQIVLELELNKYLTFEKAYIIYNNEKIDISYTIRSSEYIFAFEIGELLYDNGKTENKYAIEDTNQTIVLVKNNKEYTAEINMGYFPSVQ